MNSCTGTADVAVIMLSRSFLKAVPRCIEKSAFDCMLKSKWRYVDASKAGKVVTTMSRKVSLHLLSFSFCAASSPCGLDDLDMQMIVVSEGIFWRFATGCDIVMLTGWL